jgi:hypothetical protein
MKLTQAKRVTEIVNEINCIEKEIEKFNNTKEFCKINFVGENGKEQMFSFFVTENDRELIQELRTLVADKLKMRLEKLISELETL